MRSQSSWIALLVGLTAAAGCNLLTEPACDLRALPAIVVTVRDSVTGTPLAGGARVIARDGAFADTVESGNGADAYHPAHERAGTYEVTVEQPGYRLWSRSGVRVRRGECHVNSVRLTALLQR